MAKVASSSDDDLPTVVVPVPKKPILTKPPMTSSLDPAYLRRRAEISAQEQAFTLKSGRKLAYFVEGSTEGPDPVVVCLSCMSQSKELWIFDKPLAGVTLVAIDRMNHGNSSPNDKGRGELFSESVPEILELLDGLKVDKFFLCGWSMGATHAMMVAAAAPGRALGCAMLSGLCDSFHPAVTKKERRELDPGFGIFTSLSRPGCFGALSRAVVRMVSASMYVGPDKSKDFGMADFYKYCKSKDCGGDARTWAAMDEDPFFVSKVLDAWAHGGQCKRNAYYEWQTLFKPFCFDSSSVKCPTFIYHERKGETPIGHANQNHKRIEGSELIIMEEHGHVTIGLEAEKIIRALVDGKSVQGSYH